MEKKINKTMISPKLIDVENNRIEYVDEKDKDLLKQNYKTFIDASKRWGNSSSHGCVIKMNSSINNTSVVNENGRFPTQLFTNIKKELYKYVKNIS